MSTVSARYGGKKQANDGKLQSSDPRRCVHTEQGTRDPNAYRWWRVNLRDEYEVHYLKITNRGDCCGSYCNVVGARGHTYMHARSRTHGHTHTYAHARAQTHTHTHAHTHIHLSLIHI